MLAKSLSSPLFAALSITFAFAGCGDDDVSGDDDDDVVADASPEPDAPVIPNIDAAVDAALPDASPDAYAPFVGNLLINPDFEVDAAGWTTNGGAVTIAISTDQAHGGVNSLLAATRSASWQGAAANITETVRLGKQYTASAFVRVPTGSPAQNLKISTRHTCTETGQEFNFMTTQAAVATTDADWFQITNSFTVIGADVCTLENFIIYVEGDATGDFYVDDAEVLEVTP